MIETLIAFFAVGTLGFWLLMLVSSIIFIATIENDHFTIPTLVALGLGVAYWKPFVGMINWPYLVVGIIVFALVGVGWSVFRWTRHVNKKIQAVIKKRGGTVVTQDDLDLLKERDINPVEHKAKIIGWIAWWPWSMLWNITGDFFTMIYEAMVTVYERISEKAIGKFTVQAQVSRGTKRNQNDDEHIRFNS